jgi:hypothetical protein
LGRERKSKEYDLEDKGRHERKRFGIRRIRKEKG